MRTDIVVSDLFENSIETYKNYVSQHIPNFETNDNFQKRIRQFMCLQDVFENHFGFDEINLIETGVSGNIHYGLFGLMLGNLVNGFGGQMHSVDLDCESCENSKKIFHDVLPNLKYKTYCMDSLEFLQRPPIIPNVVHLDSFDFQLFNPFPSALHCWNEFISIEKLMPSGSIIVIDDNWFNGTYLQWIQNGLDQLIEIKYPIIGKGTHVFQETLRNNTNWEYIETNQNRFENIKLVFKKK
jgi:hypothetical protein